MTEPNPQRLPSTHLEDLAFIALSARADTAEFDPYPDLSTDPRARLRSRLKQMSRFDWPSSVKEDPALRRGYTLRQCFRLAVALQLLDAYLPASDAVRLAQHNEGAIMTAIEQRLRDPSRLEPSPDDLIAVLMSGEIQDALGLPDDGERQSARMRLVRRANMSNLWSGDLAGSGARLTLDAGSMACALWRWLSGRRLLTDMARIELLTEIAQANEDADFLPIQDKKRRR
ncbi:hypothetical protein BV96_01246 [Sphingomonas paucimobilis]|nr:hypothetical protein BV96_01246 [Sphingomonas paucimobilis]